MPSDRELLESARAVIKEQTEILERLGKGAQPIGLLLMKLPGKKAVLVMNGNPVLVEDPKLDVGTLVTTVPETGQIIAAMPANMGIGDIVLVSNVLPNGSIEVNVNGSRHAVLPGIFKGLKQGDSILLDAQKVMVLEVIERAKPPKPDLAEPVQWGDIGGNNAAKALLREAIEWPRKHPELFKHYNHKPPAGVLLYGPAGCGKTMLGKAVATTMAKGKAGGFLNIKGPEILDPYVGVTEATVRNTFKQARDYYDEHGHEAVIFIDEADALLTKRGQHGNYMGQTVVPAFLTEMDGLESSRALVILSTNRPDTLDPAIIRDGRIDFKVEITRPVEAEASHIIDIYLNKTKVVDKNLGKLAAKNLYEGKNERLPHSGALFAGVVSKAKGHALRRDVDRGGKPSGIRVEDIMMACEQVSTQEYATSEYGS